MVSLCWVASKWWSDARHGRHSVGWRALTRHGRDCFMSACFRHSTRVGYRVFAAWCQLRWISHSTGSRCCFCRFGRGRGEISHRWVPLFSGLFPAEIKPLSNRPVGPGRVQSHCYPPGGATTTGPDATHPPTIFQNLGGGRGGGGGCIQGPGPAAPPGLSPVCVACVGMGSSCARHLCSNDSARVRTMPSLLGSSGVGPGLDSMSPSSVGCGIHWLVRGGGGIAGS